MDNAIGLMNCRAQALALRLGRQARNGNEETDAEIILDNDRVISVCLNGGFLVVDGAEAPEDEDVNVVQFETETALLDFLGKNAGHSN